MIIYDRDLPTKGLCNPVGEMNIYPLTFGQLLANSADEQMTPLRDYVRNLNMLMESDERIGNVSILDSEYLLYIHKVISVSDKSDITLNIKCSECGGIHSRRIGTNEIVSRDINEEYLNVSHIELGGEQVTVKYTTIREFTEFVSKLPRYYEETRVDLIKLASMLDLPVSLALDRILDAKGDDISTIILIDNEWFSTTEPMEFECPVTKRGTMATIDLSAIDVFQSIVSVSSPKSKIKFK